MRPILLLFITVMISAELFSQSEFRKTKTMIGMEGGPIVPLSSSYGPPFLKGSGTKGFVSPVFSYFFKNNIGITALLQVIPEENDINKKDFEAWDQQQHTMDGFYINGYSYSSEATTTNVLFYTGVSYKFERRKWLFIPRALIGIGGSSSDKYTVFFKEKDSHERYRNIVEIESGGTQLAIQSGFSTYYRHRKYFTFSLGATLQYKRQTVKYTLERTQLSTEMTALQAFSSDNPQLAVRISGGIAFTFPGKRKK